MPRHARRSIEKSGAHDRKQRGFPHPTALSAGGNEVIHKLRKNLRNPHFFPFAPLAARPGPDYKGATTARALRLSVRTSDFHSEKRGSTPLGRATSFSHVNDFNALQGRFSNRASRLANFCCLSVLMRLLAASQFALGEQFPVHGVHVGLNFRKVPVAGDCPDFGRSAPASARQRQAALRCPCGDL